MHYWLPPSALLIYSLVFFLLSVVWRALVAYRRTGINPVEVRHYRDLVRNRDVNAAQAERGQRADCDAEIVGVDGEAAVVAVESEFGQPETVNQRRFRVRDGPADDAS